VINITKGEEMTKIEIEVTSEDKKELQELIKRILKIGDRMKIGISATTPQRKAKK
jgi:ribosomal protein S10